jgi:hypothetical protein
MSAIIKNNFLWHLLANRLKSRGAKPEGAKVRLKSGHASRLHHASVIKKGKC